jgi:VanZ family protein
MPLPTDAPIIPTDRPRSPGNETRDPGLLFIILAWVSVVAWAATIYWFSSRTGPQIEELNVFQLSDKVAHFIAFFAGAPPIVLALRWSTSWSWRRIAIVAACVLMMYGAADEYHQTFTVNRSGADVWDGLADALGGLTGTLITISLYARFERSRSPRRTAP